MESGAFSTKRGTRPFRCCMTGSAPFPKGWRQPEKNGKWGFLDPEGHIVLPFEYDSTVGEGFSDGLVPVRQNGREGYMDKTRRMAILLDPGYAAVCGFHSGFALVAADPASSRKARKRGPPRIRRGNRRFTGRSTGRDGLWFRRNTPPCGSWTEGLSPRGWTAENAFSIRTAGRSWRRILKRWATFPKGWRRSSGMGRTDTLTKQDRCHSLRVQRCRRLP